MARKDPRVDVYIARSAAFARPILSHLRKAVHAACPAAEETLKWSSPAFMYKGILCGMAAFKEHCVFGFWKETLLRDRLEGLEVADRPAMRRMALVVLLTALGLPVPGRAGPSPSCEEAKRINGWCEAANAGYVASVEVRSRFLYEVLDAHGHDIDPAAVTCETCRKALQTDGYCPAHKMGFVHGEAFLSPLTYHLPRARRIDPSAITCRVCRKHTRGIGWGHKIGRAQT